VVESEDFFLERHRQLFAVLRRPVAEVRMLGDEVGFLSELFADDVLYMGMPSFKSVNDA